MPRTPNKRQTRASRRTQFLDCAEDTESNGGLLAMEMRLNRLERELAETRRETRSIVGEMRETKDMLGEIRNLLINNSNNNNNSSTNNSRSNNNNLDNNDEINISENDNNRVVESVSSSTVQNSLGFIKPGKFDGSQTWESYSRQFETISNLHGWCNEVKASVLVTCLKDKAQVILENKSLEELKDFGKLTKSLEDRFGESQFSRAYFSRFQARKQKEDESLTDFSNDLDKLVNYAYPTISSEEKERIAGLQFISGLRKSKLQFSLRSERIESLRLATQRALELESIEELTYGSRDRSRYRSYNNNSESSDRNRGSSKNQNSSTREIQCWICQEYGHTRRNCKLLKVLRMSCSALSRFENSNGDDDSFQGDNSGN